MLGKCLSVELAEVMTSYKDTEDMGSGHNQKRAFRVHIVTSSCNPGPLGKVALQDALGG